MSYFSKWKTTLIFCNGKKHWFINKGNSLLAFFFWTDNTPPGPWESVATHPVPRYSHIKAHTGQLCLNILIRSLHSSQTSIAAAVSTSPTTTVFAMFCTQSKPGPGLREALIRPSKQSWTCLMIKHSFNPWLWRVVRCMSCTRVNSTLLIYLIYLDRIAKQSQWNRGKTHRWCW